jgi:hypothetical protein
LNFFIDCYHRVTNALYFELHSKSDSNYLERGYGHAGFNRAAAYCTDFLKEEYSEDFIFWLATEIQHIFCPGVYGRLRKSELTE